MALHAQGKSIRAIAAATGLARAILSTHLGNGCDALLPRHVNPIPIQLGHDQLWASFIADGHHLPPYLLKSFARAKGIAQSILTTDCMAAAGTPPGRYHLGDLELGVGEDRVVRQTGKTNFAGSALTLDHAVANVARWANIPLADAIDMASLQPAHLFGEGATTAFEPGDDLILAEHEPQFKIMAVFRAGVCVAGEHAIRSMHDQTM
jgi:N-acetylglucosamine-6-phosphate deacetylase